jgi:hypothetical protein
MNNSSIIYYPDLDDINFNKKIIEKEEFNQYIADSYVNNTIENLCLYNNFITRPIQRMLQLYLSPNTPYNGLLLYHTTGSGKTCTSILIAEQFMDYVQSNNSYIYLIAAPILLDNFNNTIFNSKKELNKLNNNNSSQCTSYIYSKIYEQYLTETKGDINKTNNLLKEYRQLRYKSYGYTALINSITKANGDYIDKDIINSRFSNSVFVIDEAHIYKKDTPTYNGLAYILTHSTNTKLLLLTATPMFDSSTQIIDLLNLLRLNDKKSKIDYNDIFESTQTDNRKLVNPELFIQLTTGYVSYLNGINPITFPLKLYPEDSIYIKLNDAHDNIIVSVNHEGYNIFPCEMNKFQYDYSKHKVLNDLIYGIQSNLIVFPSEKIGDEGFNICFKYNKDTDKYKYSCFEDFLQPNKIKKYSMKLYKLSEALKNSTGKIYISSQFIKSGVHVIAMLLEEMGYNRMKYVGGQFIISNLLKTNPSNSPSYIMVTGDTLQISKYIDKFNHIDNITGDNIQIIIGSEVVQQGVSLFGIREIHILEPWWNYSRIEQIIGRGIRDCSHINLPPKKRNIIIYNYISTYKNEFTNDLNQLTKTLDKNINIKKVSRLLKQNAIDCFISKNINVSKDYPDIEITTSKNITKKISQNDVNYSLECDYDICDYNCIGVEKIENVDVSTYNIFNDTVSNINISKIYIKKSFELKLFYTLEQLNYIIIAQDKYINDKSIFLALVEIINNKEVIHDKFNRPGYIIQKSQYYIFQPNEILDEFIPIYLRKYPLKNRLYSIKNLIKYTEPTTNNLTISSDISYNYYDKLVINKLLHNSQLYNKLLNNIDKNVINKLSLFDLLYIYIDKLEEDNNYIIDILLTSHIPSQDNIRYSLNLINNFSNENLTNKYTIYKNFYYLELVSIEYKIIILQYLIIKSLLKKTFTSLDNFLINYYIDILIKHNNVFVGFIIYKHNPNYINEYINGNDPYTEIPYIYIYYKNIWYSNLSLNDISYINININGIIKNITKKYNENIIQIRKNIINNNHILGLIGKSQNKDIYVFKIIKFVEQNIIKKKEKLTNITISIMKDLQYNQIVTTLKFIINSVKKIIEQENIIYNIVEVETEFEILLSNENTKKKHIMSLIIYLLLDLQINKIANRTWLISAHQAAILKRNSLLNISRTDKQNTSLSIHKGLSIQEQKN